VRVTAATKTATRARILEEARALFAKRGFEDVTTRDIAVTAEIATGTLFNYFPTKEAIAATLALDTLVEVHARFEKKRRRGASLEEDLFGLIAAELRGLKLHRSYFSPVLEAIQSPQTGAASAENSIRARHWTVVSHMLADHGVTAAPSFITLHLYWALYAGVLSFWSSDASPNQEDSLAVLDQSLKAFQSTLPIQASPRD
jgi:AcrR family transcriptional regulator